MWSGGGSSRSLNFGHSEMGMVGLRDVFVVAPASSYHHHHNDVVMADPHHNAATIHGVIPLLTAAPCLDGDTSNMLNLSSHNNNRSRNTGIQLWQDHYLKKQGLNPEHGNGTTTSGNLAHSGGGGLSGGSGLSSGGTTCQDCGNQAKKDCSHRRCRTCCKSRGFDCHTHVKSTWVPAARRRERQLVAGAAASGGGGGFSGATSGSKKPRLVASQTTTTSRTSTSNTTPRSFDTGSSHQDASFKESLPGQVRAPAVFKCVRVTAVDDGDDEYAYQAVVKIGGHVFKGFLYDQGVENGDGYPNLSELHLGGGGGGGNGGTSGGAGRNGATSSSLMLDPSDVYAAGSGGAMLAGSTYGNAIN